MNDLYNKPPKALTISGKKYRIYTDYRVWMNFEEKLIKSDNISFLDIISLIFVSELPPVDLYEEAVEQILWFYRCGQSAVNDSNGNSGKQIFDYDFDAGYIFAAFLQQYKIDIGEIDIHWWKFRALFLALPEDTEFVKIMGYRSISISSKMTAEEKAFYTKMKKLYAIPLPRDVQDKYNAIEEALLEGKPIDGLL